MKFLPVTLRAFGISLTTLIPSGGIVYFLAGGIFWATAGPLVKWSITQAARSISNFKKSSVLTS